MTNINEYIYPVLDDLFNTEFSDWSNVELNIESSLSYVGTSVKYYSNTGSCITNREKSLLPKSKMQILTMHRAMENEPNVFEKWNTAKLVLNKDGKYDLSFQWNQDLQDSWESCK